MSFRDIYDNYLKDMVDGPRVEASEYKGEGLPPHEDEFKGLIKSHFELKCFHPMRGGDLKALTDLHKEMLHCAKDPDFAHLVPSEFPDRTTYTRLPRGDTAPQNLNALYRQQRTFLKLIQADQNGELETKPELKRLLTVTSGNELFKHPDNSIKASFYRLQRDGLKAIARDLGMKNRPFGQVLFGTANGHNTLERIYDDDELLSVTYSRLKDLNARFAELYKEKEKDYDNITISWHVTNSNNSIEPLKNDNGNDLN